MDVILKLASSNYWWIPMAIFGGILLIGLIFGCVNGSRAAFYFMLWNFAGLAVGIFVFVQYRETIWNYAYTIIKQRTHYTNLELGLMVQSIGPTLKIIFSAIATMALILGLNILALFIYFPIRRFLKRPLRRRHSEDGRGEGAIAAHRLIGGGLGVVTALPTALFAAATALGLSNYEANPTSKKFYDFTTTISKGISFGKYPKFPEQIEKVKLFLALPSKVKELTWLQALINEQIKLVRVKEANYDQKITNAINKNYKFFEELFRLPDVLANYEAWITRQVTIIGSSDNSKTEEPSNDKIPVPDQIERSRLSDNIKGLTHSIKIPEWSLTKLAEVLREKIYIGELSEVLDFLKKLGADNPKPLFEIV